MDISIRTLDEVIVVGVAGAVDSRSSGYLYDVLVECISEGRMTLIVDLSGVHMMTRAGGRGLVVAAKLMQSVRGELRICGAQQAIALFLQKLGFNHLLSCDPTLQSSMTLLYGEDETGAKAAATVVPFGAPAPAAA